VLPSPPLGQIKDQSPLPDAVPGRFTGAVFVAEEKPLDAGFDAALTRLANLRRGGALMTSLVDCYRAGYDRPGPARPAGLATPSPDWADEQASRRKLGIAGGGSDQVQRSEGQGQGDVHR